MMKAIVVVAALIFGISLYGQSNLNDYKYVVVPTSYGFLSDPDQYYLNTLSKLLFQKYGFNSYLENEALPEDLTQNNCLALRANVEEDNSIFTRKLIVTLKDCKNNIIFSSAEGTSKEKSYKIAYNEAIRQAFESFSIFKYSYNGDATEIAENEENILVKEEKLSDQELTRTEKAETDISAAQTENKNIPNLDMGVDAVVVENEAAINLEDKEPAKKKAEYELARNATGFSLYDSKNNTLVGKGLKTSEDGVYLFQSDTITGLARFEDENMLVVEYNEGDSVVKTVFKF